MIEQAELALADRRFDDAIVLYQGIEKRFLSHAAMSAVRIGDIRVQQGRPDLAVAAYQRATELYPKGSMRYGAYDKLKALTKHQDKQVGGTRP